MILSKARDTKESNKEIHNITNIENSNKEKLLSNKSEIFKETWKKYEEMRIDKKCPIKKEHTMKLILKRLSEYSKGNEQIEIRILENSIIGHWQGIFPLKENNQNQNRKDYFPPNAIKAPEGKYANVKYYGGKKDGKNTIAEIISES